MNGIFSLDAESFKSALISTLLMAFLGVAGYVISLQNVFAIDWHALVNVAVMSLLTGLVSLTKNFLTSNSGVFAGVVKTQ